MKYLLDVSAIVALLWKNHVNHAATVRWAKGKKLVVCPLTELGFLRVSTSPAFNATMDEARTTLKRFLDAEAPDFIPADMRALDGTVATISGKTTDWYLASLAARHGMQWATLDVRASHPARVLVA